MDVAAYAGTSVASPGRTSHQGPRATGGAARPLVERIEADGESMLELGRATEGGVWGWWFCVACNGLTGTWDEEYLRWQKPILGWIYRDEPPQPLRPGEFAAHDPGAFVRALWAWMFALDKGLFDSHPDLASAVRTGSRINPPRDLRLLVVVTTSRDMWLSLQLRGFVVKTTISKGGWHQHQTGLWTPLPELVELPLIVIAAPPFVGVLVDADRELLLVDTGPWLSETSGRQRTLALHLPTVEVRKNSAGVVSYEDIVALEPNL